MLHLNFQISNPFSERFENIKCWSGATPFKHKFWELQIMATHYLILFNFSFTIRTDHAGLRLVLGLFGYEIDFNIYDCRHWDYEKDRWHDKEDIL